MRFPLATATGMVNALVLEQQNGFHPTKKLSSKAAIAGQHGSSRFSQHRFLSKERAKRALRFLCEYTSL